MIGKQFGSWTILNEFKHTEKSHDTTYECVCNCGIKNIVRRYCLTRGRSKACRSCSKKTHGYTGTPTYVVWEGMKKRCNTPSSTHYKRYGGRGIKLCERWETFDNFLLDMGERPEGKQLDRIDNNGDYEPSNCRWVTPQENTNNREVSKRVTEEFSPGNIFGRWTVIERVFSSKKKEWAYLCRCECGFTSEVKGKPLRDKTSAGCNKCHLKDLSEQNIGRKFKY